MDVMIITSDPDSIDADEIRTLLEGAGYMVGYIAISDRD